MKKLSKRLSILLSAIALQLSFSAAFATTAQEFLHEFLNSSAASSCGHFEIFSINDTRASFSVLCTSSRGQIMRDECDFTELSLFHTFINRQGVLTSSTVADQPHCTIYL